MAKPSHNLSSKEQKSVLSAFKSSKNARTIAETLGLSRRQVMAFLESKQLVAYAEGSYL